MELQKEIQMAMNTAKNTNYLNRDYQYLKNVQITEWDIKSAGLSVLKFRKLLPQDELESLSKMEKHARTVKEGLLQRDNPKVAEEIINTLSSVRQAFVLLNKITDDQILSIKKDAMFLINKNPNTTIIKDYFEFRKKGVYTSYMLFDKKEFYYDIKTDTLDTKGIPKEVLEKQNEYFLKDIKKFLRSGERYDNATMYIMLKQYALKYINRELPIETYRELDSGKYRIRNYLVENVSEDMKNELDITQNYMNYIVPLINVML